MRLPSTLALVVVFALAALAPSGHAALPEQTIVAAPGAWLTTYAVPAVVVEQGDALTFQNLDIMHHDVISEQAGSDDAPWCDGFPTGACPLFWSPLIGLSESAPVLGLELVQPGATYTYTCSIHPGMTGTLVALQRPD